MSVVTVADERMAGLLGLYSLPKSVATLPLFQMSEQYVALLFPLFGNVEYLCSGICSTT